MPMILMSSKASPFVRKVRVLITEADRWAEVEEDVTPTTPVDSAPAVLAANPLGKIPALIREDGPTLHDSRVITRYLDDRWSLGLYPPSRLWEVLTLESMADAIMEAAVGLVYAAKFHAAPDAAWAEAQWTKVARALDAIEDRWISHLSGPLDMGQVATGCALGYLDLRHADRGWREGRPVLTEWAARFAERPSMVATVPVG